MIESLSFPDTSFTDYYAAQISATISNVLYPNAVSSLAFDAYIYNVDATGIQQSSTTKNFDIKVQVAWSF